MPDPLTATYLQLWEIVDNYEPLRVVNAGNKVNFTKEYDRDFRNIPSDQGGMPQLILLPDYLQSNLNTDNSQGSIIRAFNWTIRTATFGVNRDLFPIEWEICKAMFANKNQLIKDIAEVRHVDLVRGRVNLPEVDVAQRTAIAWNSIITVEVSYNLG